MAPSEIRLALEEIDRTIQQVAKRMDGLEADIREIRDEIRSLSSCYDDLKSAPARSALERQRETVGHVVRAVITTLTATVIGGVVFVVSKMITL